ncbi:MAG: DUF192 domain-containing protein [bacterium]
MRIINKSNQKLIAEKVKIADNFLKRTQGLLDRSKLDKGEGLLIIPCNCIHSFGMKFNFDVIFLDKNNKVKYLIKNMKPWRISPLIITAYSILEIPVKTIDETDIKIGDLLELFIY